VTTYLTDIVILFERSLFIYKSELRQSEHNWTNYTESDIERIYCWNNVKIMGNEQIHFNLVRFK
jgi:hypothetical protein